MAWRAAVRLWWLGISVRSDRLRAMSRNADWSAYLSHEHIALIDDKRLPCEVLRQRLMEVVKAEEPRNEAVNGHMKVPTGGHEKSPPLGGLQAVGSGAPPRCRASFMR
jgi:hypothetical protein